MSRSSVVFVTPVLPAFGGMGLAMRAAHTLQALAEHCDVSLAVVDLQGAAGKELDPRLRAVCRRFLLLNAPVPAANGGWKNREKEEARWGQKPLPGEWGSWDPEKGAELERFLEEVDPGQLWLFRFYLLPWVHSWMERGKPACLDLDELDSRQRRQLARLYREEGRSRESMLMLASALAYQQLEKRFLPRFRTIAVASESEAAHVRAYEGVGRAEVWPNVIAPAAEPAAVERMPDGVLRLFYIGYMGYLPNRDAVGFAAREILPALRSRLRQEVVLQVAGRGAEAFKEEWAAFPGVEVLGEIPEVGPAYARADLVLVPLRAGSGTRLKILEAFAHRKAVVSTRIGVEGLEVRHGRELLLADAPGEIAEACASLLRDRERAGLLARAGHAFVHSRHGPAMLSAHVARWADALS